MKTFRRLSELEELSSEWDKFLEKSFENNVFLSWEWVGNWIKIYKLQEKLLTVVVYDDDAIAAIAPLWVDRVPFSGFVKLKALRFLGSNEVCSDHLDLIVRDKNSKELLGLIWEHLFGSLSKEWDVLAYNEVPTNSNSFNELNRLADRDDRCLWKTIHSHSICPYIELPKTWEEFLASLSVNQRRALKVSNTRLEEAGCLKLKFCEQPDQLDEELDRLIDMNRRAWNERGQAGSFATREFEQFHRSVAREFLARGWLFLCSLWLKDKHIGSFYGFQHGGKLYFYIIGVDRNAVERGNVGRVLLGKCIEESIKRGCKEFDFLRGDEGYKYDWTELDRKNTSTTIYQRHFRSHYFIAWRFFCEYSKQIVKSLLRKHWYTLKKILKPSKKVNGTKEKTYAAYD